MAWEHDPGIGPPKCGRRPVVHQQRDATSVTQAELDALAAKLAELRKDP